MDRPKLLNQIYSLSLHLRFKLPYNLRLEEEYKVKLKRATYDKNAIVAEVLILLFLLPINNNEYHIHVLVSPPPNASLQFE